MRYDFTTRPQRSESGSSKWNSMLKINPSAFHGIVPLSVADMEFPLAPPIAQALSRFSQTSCLGYTDPTDEYYEACVLWQRRRHGWPAEKDWIATTPGVVPALFNAVRSFASEGDGVIIQPPVYRPFRDAIERGGRRVVENPLLPPDGDALGTAGRPRYRIDFEDLAIKAADPRARLLLLCSPHNPVGRVWEPAELRRLLDKHNIRVESFYPVGHGDKNLLSEHVFEELAHKYGKSPVQIILKWHIQEGFIPLPKSTNPQHIRDNISLDFTLSAEDMEKIRAIDKDKSYFDTPEEEQERIFMS